MTRSIIIGIVALAVGSLSGGLLVRSQLGGQIEALAAQNQELAKTVQDLSAPARDDSRLAALEELKAENRDLYSQLNDLERELAAATQMAAVDPASPDLAGMDGGMADAALGGEAEPEEDRRNRWANRGGENGEDGEGPPDWRRMTPEERQERANQFVQTARERVYDFMADEMAKTNDPVVRQRLASISEYSDYMLQVGQQLRTAETDEERDQLRQAFSEARETVQQLSQEQQNYMLSQVASEYGITDPNKQREFLEQLRSTQESPYFRSPQMLWGFGGGFGGRGGPPRGGGR